jgi:PAS domain-containing protein
MICTRIGGWPAGLSATIISALASSWFFMTPTGSFAVTNPNDLFRLTIFLLISLMILSLHASRNKAELQLRASEQRLMLALDSARMGVWDYNLLTRKFWWSKTLEVIYDRSGREFANSYGRFFGYIHFDDQPLFNRAITRTIDEGTDYEVDHRIVLPDNSIRWVNTRGRVFFNQASRAERIVGVAVDITAKKKLERQQELSREAANDPTWSTVA